MKKYFKLIDENRGTYCYDQPKIDYFLHNIDYIGFGRYGLITGI